MTTLKSFRNAVIWCLVLLIALPPPVFAQEAKAGARQFSREQLDQMLAPIALYPDSLLAQIFIASTYPLEVVMADRWVDQNKGLKGDELSNALVKQPWDDSVKALVPFPDVLSMMSHKLDWTQMVGDAFLAQQADVMDTVQHLRKRASEAGNLKPTEQQKIIVEQEIIRIEPANPSVVYVPVYDPWWVYGRWWWPYHPPYAVYPYPPGFVYAPGFIWFGAGLFVGAYWANWGYWNWHTRGCYVNTSRNVTVTGGAVGGAWASKPWTHNPAHRGGVAYRDAATREKYGQQANRAAVEGRRNFRGYEGNWIERGARSGRTESASAVAGRPGRPDGTASSPAFKAGRPEAGANNTGTVAGRSTRRESAASSSTVRAGRPEAVAGRTGKPDAAVSQPQAGRQAQNGTAKPSAERSRSGQVFEGIGRGNEVQRQSHWGRESLNAARSSGGTVGDVIRGGAGGQGGFRGGTGGGASHGSVGGGFGGGGMRGGHR